LCTKQLSTKTDKTCVKMLPKPHNRTDCEAAQKVTEKAAVIRLRWWKMVITTIVSYLHRIHEILQQFTS